MSYDSNQQGYQQGAAPGYGAPHPQPGGDPAPAPGFQAPPPGYPASGGYGPGGQPPTSAVAWVVVGFIFFWPVGIAALLSSLKITPAWYAGDHAGAQRYADQAKTRGKIALFIGIALTVLYVGGSVILFATSDV